MLILPDMLNWTFLQGIRCENIEITSFRTDFHLEKKTN